MVIFNISLDSATPSSPSSETSHGTTTPPPGAPYGYNSANSNDGHGNEAKMSNHDRWIAVPNIPRPVHILEVRRAMDQQRYGRCNAPNTVCHNRPVRRLIQGQTRNSQYCEYHHCDFVEDGRPCPTAKPPANERFCNDHLKCQFRNLYVMGRGQCNNNVKDNDPFRYRFCEMLHACRVDRCPRERAHTTDERLSDYCADHRCSMFRCTAARGRGPFCPNHTCDAEGCFSMVYDGDHPWCERHRGCAVQGCRRQRFIRPSGTTAPYCDRHCCDFEDYERRRVEGGRYCTEHRCAAIDCGQGRVPGSRFCRDHARGGDFRGGGGGGDQRCAVRFCDRPRLFNSIYCTIHDRDGDDYGYGRDWGGAGGGGGGGGGGGWGWGGGNGRPGGGDDPVPFNVCHYHNGNRGCNQRPIPGTDFCDEHICSQRPCGNQRTVNSDYCTRHKCRVPECRSAVAAPAIYCERHRCSEPGCQGEKIRIGDYCEMHMRCAERGCGRIVAGGGLCREHERGRDPRGGLAEDDLLVGRDGQRWDARELLRSEREERERGVRDHLPEAGWERMRYPGVGFNRRRPQDDEREGDAPWYAFGMRRIF